MGDVAEKSGRWEAIKREFRLFWILFLYLWALLGLFVLNEDAFSREAGHHFVLQGFAVINALFLAKVMLVSEHFEISRWLSSRPRVWTIVYEAAVCTLLFLAVHVLERIVIGLVHGQTISASMPSFGGGGLSGLLIVALILFVCMLPFFTFKSVARAIGPEHMRAILFRAGVESG